MKHPERVRFWTKFEGQWRGIQLELDGDAVELHGGGPHEEGAEWYAEVYTYEVMDCGTAVVRCEMGSWGRDCDGRHSSEWKGYALVSELEKVTTYAKLGYPPRPYWREEGCRQRDYSAEAAGY
jgi:hypothetical protein